MKKEDWYKVVLLMFLIGIFALPGNSQNHVRWMTWKEALEANKKVPKKFLVDIYTPWCGWCKKMEKSTFQQNYIAKYINQNYYPVKFNSENDVDILFQDKVYKLIRNGRKKYHELAIALTQGKLSYPTIVFLDEDTHIIQSIPGFQDAATFELIMTYFAENHHKTTPWHSYVASYKSNLKAIPVGN